MFGLPDHTNKLMEPLKLNWKLAETPERQVSPHGESADPKPINSKYAAIFGSRQAKYLNNHLLSFMFKQDKVFKFLTIMRKSLLGQDSTS